MSIFIRSNFLPKSTRSFAAALGIIVLSLSTTTWSTAFAWHPQIDLGLTIVDPGYRDDPTRDPDTLFPLQGALGYEISQSLFVGKNTLLLEGPSDILYIQALSNALRSNNRTGLDPRWTMCPAGGIDKIQPFVALFSGNALHVAVLSDQAVGDKRKIEEMRSCPGAWCKSVALYAAPGG